MRLGIAVLLLIAATACGGGEGVAPNASGPTESASATPKPSKTPKPGPTDKTFTSGQLRNFLTRLQDLPAGWSLDRSDSGDDDASTSLPCGYKRPFEPSAAVGRSFTKGGGFTSEYISVGVLQFETEKQATAVVNAFKKTFTGCTATVGGEKVRYELVSTDEVADQTFGIKATAESQEAVYIYSRSGRGVSSVAVSGYVSLDFDLGAKLNKQQIVRYAKAVR